MPDWTDLPNDSTALARIAITSESGDLRTAALLRLIPIINRIASEAARANQCEEIKEEAVGYVWEKLQEGKFEPERGPFDSWSRVVLYHRAADLRKRFSRRILHSAEPIDGLNLEEMPEGRANDTVTASDAFRGQLDHLRCEVDRLSRLLPQKSNGVAYFAVFLLQLRLAMARRASHANVRDLISNSDFIAECLPWRREEGELRLRSGCPALSEVWEGIRGFLDQHPHWITGIRLCEELRLLFGESGFVTPDVWAQWVMRAKRLARQHLDERTWNELFAPFFADR